MDVYDVIKTTVFNTSNTESLSRILDSFYAGFFTARLKESYFCLLTEFLFINFFNQELICCIPL